MLVDPASPECADALGTAVAPLRHLLLTSFSVDAETGRMLPVFTKFNFSIASDSRLWYREWCCEVCGRCSKWDRNARAHAAQCKQPEHRLQRQHDVSSDGDTSHGLACGAGETLTGRKRQRRNVGSTVPASPYPGAPASASASGLIGGGASRARGECFIKRRRHHDAEDESSAVVAGNQRVRAPHRRRLAALQQLLWSLAVLPYRLLKLHRRLSRRQLLLIH